MFSLKTQISRFLIGAILIFMMLALILLGVMTRNYRKQKWDSYKDDVVSYAETLNDSILQLNDTVGEIYISNSAFENLSSSLPEAAQYENAYELLTLMRIQVRSVQNLSGLFVFYDNADRQVYYVRSDMSFEDKEVLKNSGKALIDTISWNYENSVITAEDEVYYTIFMKKSLVTVMGAVRLSLGLPESADGGESFGVLYEDTFYSALGEYGLTEEECSSLEYGWNVLSDRIVYLYGLESCEMSAAVILPQSLWLYVGAVHIVLFVLMIMFGILLFHLYRFISRQLSWPLEDMNEALMQIRAGEWEVEFHAQNRLTEIENVRQTVRLLLKRIEQYKIQSYEEQLEVQKTKLQYYQLQLAPHFYTNCLKNAYYMLMLNEYENAGQFLLCLSTHIRYLLQKDADVVELRKEMDFVENYIMLQNLMDKRQILYSCDADEETAEKKIPILALQVFVENSVKYADNTGKADLRITVAIRVHEIEDQEYLDITVRDNGVGYPKEVLQMLNLSDPVRRENLGVGVINLLSRMRIQYRDEAKWYFRNEGGAVSELFIPLNPGKRGLPGKAET